MRLFLIVIAAAGLAACSDPKSQTGGGDPRLADGRTIAEEQCSRCHAVGASGESLNPKAPVFRTILSRYAEDALADDLAEGIRIGHPDMPQIALRPEGVDALIAYLRSIQDKPGG
jgi:mono/diheme cytochrome c family protein